MRLENVLESCQMVQLTTGSQSVRVRKHKFYEGAYFATVRHNNQHGEISYDLETTKDAVEFVQKFSEGNL